MKKNMRMILCLLLVLLCAFTARAQETKDLEGFVLDEKYVMSGMDKSWYQGYEPQVSGGSVTICVPVTSKSSNGKLTATLIMEDEEIAPIRTQKRSAIFWRQESGLFEVKLSFKLSDSRINGDYKGKVLLEGTNKDGRYMFTEYPVVIRIRDGKNNVVHPEFSQVTAELSVGKEGKISAVLTNTGRYADLTDLLLTVTDASGDVFPEASDTLKLGKLLPNQSVTVEYPVVVSADAPMALHELTFHLTYTAAGQNGSWTEVFTLPVGRTSSVEGTLRLQPNISDVTSSLNVGENGTISALLTNADAHTSMHNLILTVTDSSGDVIPAGSDMLKLGTLKAGESVLINYPVSVKPTASVSLHELTFKLTYTASGKDGNWTETFTMPVSQQMRLEQGGVQMATTAVQGDIASVTLPLMNMGRGNINNVMAILSIPEVVERQSVLVGTIAPGETKQAKLNFTPGKNILGDVAGTITVTAEDAWGNKTEFSVPVELTIEEPVKLTVSGTIEKEEKPPYLMYVFMGVSVLLLIALILQGMIMGAKIRKLEEDRL